MSSGIEGLTVSEIEGSGKHTLPPDNNGITREERPLTQIYTEPRVLLEVVTDEKNSDQVLDIINSLTHTGSHGDGTVFIHNIEKVIRIRDIKKDRIEPRARV